MLKNSLISKLGSFLDMACTALSIPSLPERFRIISACLSRADVTRRDGKESVVALGLFEKLTSPAKVNKVHRTEHHLEDVVNYCWQSYV
jgi:hypothetical protein